MAFSGWRFRPRHYARPLEVASSRALYLAALFMRRSFSGRGACGSISGRVRPFGGEPGARSPFTPPKYQRSANPAHAQTPRLATLRFTENRLRGRLTTNTHGKAVCTVRKQCPLPNQVVSESGTFSVSLRLPRPLPTRSACPSLYRASPLAATNRCRRPHRASHSFQHHRRIP